MLFHCNFSLKVQVFGAVVIWLERAGWGTGDRSLPTCTSVDPRSGREAVGSVGG